MPRPDRDAAETLADVLSEPWSEALAQHAHVTCMRIRMLARALRRETSERHRRGALRLSPLRLSHARIATLANWITDTELDVLARGRVADHPAWMWLLGRGLMALVVSLEGRHLVRTPLGAEVMRVAMDLRGKEAA